MTVEEDMAIFEAGHTTKPVFYWHLCFRRDTMVLSLLKFYGSTV